MLRLGLSWRALCAEPAPAVARVARLVAELDRVNRSGSDEDDMVDMAEGTGDPFDGFSLSP